MNNKSNPFKVRLIGVFIVFVVAIIAIWFRVLYLQVFRHSHYLAAARSQQLGEFVIPPDRGNILDRNGNMLAVSVDMDSVWTNKGDSYSPGTVKKIARILREPLYRVRKKFKKKRLWIGRKVFASQAEQLRKLDLEGVVFLKESRRFYPKRKLAGQVMGFLGVDNSGLGGLEYRYDKSLKGKKKKVSFFRDGKKRLAFLNESTGNKGHDLVLTIDAQIQYIAEKELLEGCRRRKAKRGMVIVSEPNSGEILAMANYPLFDPNKYKKYKAYTRKNRAVADAFEPGSTMKVFLASAAIEKKLYSVNDTIDCLNGKIRVGRLTFHDHESYESLTFSEVFEHSSNVGAISIGLKLKPERIYEYYKKFGFGRRTNLGLPGESSGKLKNVSIWTPSSIGAFSIGQEMSVTTVQLAQALNAVANGGVLMPSKIILPNVSGSKFVTRGGKRVISKRTAGVVRRVMQKVVENGTGKSASLEGYSVAGKTGTAQKYDTAKKRYSKNKYVASFMGFLPVGSPRFSIVVVVDQPRPPEIWGSVAAAPIFKNIASQLVGYMSIPPDKEVFKSASK